MRGERILHDGQIVLAREREDDPAIAQAEHGALELLERAARVLVPQLDAGHAVVSDDAAPQRVVEIEHETLRGGLQRAAQRAREVLREERLVGRGHRHAGERPQARVGPARRACGGDEPRVVPHVTAAARRHLLEQRAVQARHLVGERALLVRVEDRREARVGDDEVRDQRGTLRAIAEERERALDAAQHVRRDRGERVVGVSIDAEPDVGMEILEAHHHDHHLGDPFGSAPTVPQQLLLELGHHVGPLVVHDLRARENQADQGLQVAHPERALDHLGGGEEQQRPVTRDIFRPEESQHLFAGEQGGEQKDGGAHGG